MKHLGSRRIEALTLALVDTLGATAELQIRDRGEVVRRVAARLRSAFQVDDALDKAARERIASLRRPIPEGSREWDLLYQQYLEELSRRRG